ncbi:acetyltransferase [Legionella donaldsonii]|uniref:Acetyltransferase n=1 Tax=Legionella donaldsonii TaxID=45060 RepID=A0A378J4Y9_9GAMM|nr:GNAT family N-acetyltransferase [Legionella donaldsonii]STX42823.1 acetyltransferase [Legionella donaldsonii]
MTIIRSAARQDATALLPLLKQLGYPQSLEEIENRIALFSEQDGYGIAVAERDKKIIACIAWSTTMIFVSSKVRIHVEGLVVDNQYRGQGIGKKLMHFLEDYARAFCPCIIDLTSGQRRAKDGSHDFYKKLGYLNEGPMAKYYFRKEL